MRLLRSDGKLKVSKSFFPSVAGFNEAINLLQFVENEIISYVDNYEKEVLRTLMKQYIAKSCIISRMVPLEERADKEVLKAADFSNDALDHVGTLA